MGRFLFLNLLFQLLWLNFTYGQLFDYGERYGDRIERYSENQLAITFTLPIVYLEKSYDELFISFDGIAGFQKLPAEYTPLQNMNISTIAVYYAPVTNTHLYYRVTSSNRNLLHKLNEFIHESFDDAIEFHTLEAVIVTWERVKNHETNSAEATFQLALATDGRESYCIMQYRNLPWAASKGFFAQSGFTHQDGRHTLNTNSGTSLVNELINLSNTKSDKYSGFAFRISGSAIEDPKEDPENYDYRSYEDSYENDVDHKEPENCPEDPYKDKCPQECTILYDQRGCSKCVCAEVTRQENSVELEESSKYQTHREPPAMKQTKSGIHFPENVCESEANDCNENAECESYKTGHCCRCSEGWTGNGHTCIVKGDPVRISGNFEGVINGKPIDKTDLHTFVTTTDGRSFTAVSKISSDLGHSFLLLHPIGSVMGWLFAVAGPDAYNGFELTGGVLNRTVALHIGDRYRVSIRQEFHGQDDYQYLKSNVYIHGTLPEVAPGAEVTVPDYVEEYKRESPGFLRSYTTADVKVKEGQDTQTYRMIIDQQIHYKECPHKPFDLDPNQSLYVERVHVVYSEENDGIVRYGSKNTIRKTSDKTSQIQQQPAFERKQHGQPQQQVHAPVNLQQAQVSGSNPCAEGQHRCTLPNMKCRVVDPSYRCECHPGYQAQHDHTSPIGWRCIDLDECQRGDHSCDRQHASCMNTEGSFTCRCMDGYTGNGHQCFPLDSGAGLNIQPPRQQQEQGQTNIGSNECTSHSQCHQWGECVFTPGNPRGYCKCRGWYQGDGVKHCGPPGDRQPQLNANIPKAGGKPCGTHVCSENAECMPDTRGGSECVCKVGFVGNGIRCEALLDEEINQAPDAVGTVCRSHEECSHHGSCAYSHALGYYQCACTPPYIGNGIDCNLPGQPSQSGDEIDIPSNQPQGCDVTQDCSEFADCIFERTKEGGIYKCVCQAGYTGDGKYCMASQLGIQGLPPLQPLGCDVLKNCDANAQCVYDSHTNTHKCECYEGYVGNGQTCVLIHSGQRNWEGQPQRPGPKQCREQTDCHQNAHCVVTEDGRTNICECLPGFRGDGVTQCADADECSPAKLDSCRQNEECVFGDKEQAYVCKCMKGFMGEPGKCRPHAPPTTCQENPRLCHANAQCIFRHETNRHECLCKPGSVGDGYQRCDVMESPQCSNCSIHAHCAQNPVTGGWTCKCNVGFTGNGIICGATTSCLEDKSICDEHAQCVPGEGGHYVCSCDYNYVGDGRTCRPVYEDQSDKLLIARGMAIFERGTSPDIPGKQLIVIPNHIPVGIDYDCDADRIYWSDITGHTIRSSNMNGTDLKEILTKELSSPEGIAVDWKSGNIYYADSAKDEIGVASLNGKYQKTLLNEGLVNPRSIAIDFNSRHLYYADWHRQNPFIGRMDLDGENNRVFLNDQIHLPNGIVVLPNRRELCWVDAGSHRLSCIGLNGANRRVVYANIQYPFGLTHSNEERFYWTDWKDNRIHTVGVYGEGYNSFPISLGGSGKVYGILSVPKICNPPPSPCEENNGGCKALCLPSSTNEAICECPDNTSVKGC